MSNIEQHKHYERAYRAYSGTSFSPEKRAKSVCEWYDSIQTEFAGKTEALERFEKLFTKQLAAKYRCVSSMIAGPANFPVARMQKYNEWEHKASEALTAFVAKIRDPRAAGPMRTELDYGIEAKEYQIGDVMVKHDTEDNRIKLTFPDKPEPEMIEKLKGRGFKWSPRNKVWQRQLTPNAIVATRNVLAKVE